MLSIKSINTLIDGHKEAISELHVDLAKGKHSLSNYAVQAIKNEIHIREGFIKDFEKEKVDQLEDIESHVLMDRLSELDNEMVALGKHKLPEKALKLLMRQIALEGMDICNSLEVRPVLHQADRMGVKSIKAVFKEVLDKQA